MEIKNLLVKDLRPQKEFQLHGKNAKAIRCMIESFQTHGLQLPLLVRKQGHEYLILDGNLRLMVWKHLEKGSEIPCIIIESTMGENSGKLDIFEDVKPFTEAEEAANFQDVYIAIAVNLVRSKVDYGCLKKIVRYMSEDLHLGYGTIAHRIGYTKAGIQKMLGRMKICEKQDGNTNYPPGHTLKRVQTELRKLEETVPDAMENSDEIREAFQVLNNYISELIKNSQTI